MPSFVSVLDLPIIPPSPPPPSRKFFVWNTVFFFVPMNLAESITAANVEKAKNAKVKLCQFYFPLRGV